MSEEWEERGDVANTVNGDISGGTAIQGRDMTLRNSSPGRDHNDFHHFNGTFISEQHNHLPRHEVDWPVRVGTIPEEAAHYQHRDVADHLNTALNSFGTVVLRQVLSGTGGVGKTQLAACHARTLREITDADQRVDILVWAGASTREQITSDYTQAARHLYTTVPEDPEDAARLFLAWLSDPNKHQNRRWLIVWDDLTDPARVQDLWPPRDQPHGRVLVTTRRRDHSLTVQGRHLLDVDVYTPGEARAFLNQALDAAGIAHTTAQRDTLAHDLGRLPLALGQAVTYMAELGLGCDDYLQVFHNRMNTLDQVFPDWEHPTPLAATWELSLTQADTFQPKGTARRLMGLIALLDGTGIPEQVLTAPPVLDYLTAHRTEAATGVTTAALTPHQARTALAGLRRLNLITRATPPTTDRDAPGQVLVGAHQLVQRATHEHATTRPTSRGVHALADALVEVWPKVERDTALAQQLRSNIAILRSHPDVEGRTSEDWLWDPEGHAALFRAGTSLGEAGRVGEAVAYWQHVVETAQRQLGPDHSDTLIARANLASWRGEAGDPAAAAHAFQEILTDRLRVLGPDHPHTLTTRANLADWRGETGDLAEAISAYEDLLTDQLRILGPDYPDTLITQGRLAAWRGETGDLAEAISAYEDLLTDQLRVLGPDHPDTLTTRHSLAWWTHESGDTAAALTAYEDLLTDRLRVLGPDHPDTLTTRHNLAWATHESGDTAAALTAYEDLLTDRLRVLGPDHPDTLTTRHNLAWATHKSGDTAGAVELLTALVCDQTRVLGPSHTHVQESAQILQQWRNELAGE
ncbi:tetratricopeptide (TPR) repeat protein [Nocardiopsis sp. Huas11]|uniref:tetratricopeptide repeat protein n=1 Tax=Nocardiopsis sp. Huas11 TaxID=2183912 RepID=UPI000EAF4808|nr:tetratricopeptide repeat protein [Nocardiopsis sp. Huas11]RKS08492.1 tetratricopeptide (TPR) repeat protein [Nocardiopsis sp. Huas11]